jgi:hypothetical protein
VYCHQATLADVQRELFQVIAMLADLNLRPARNLRFGSRRARVRIPPSRPGQRQVSNLSAVPSAIVAGGRIGAQRSSKSPGELS